MFLQCHLLPCFLIRVLERGDCLWCDDRWSMMIQGTFTLGFEMEYLKIERVLVKYYKAKSLDVSPGKSVKPRYASLTWEPRNVRSKVSLMDIQAPWVEIIVSNCCIFKYLDVFFFRSSGAVFLFVPVAFCYSVAFLYFLPTHGLVGSCLDWKTSLLHSWTKLGMGKSSAH